MIELEPNKLFLIHEGHFPTFNRNYFEALIPMVYTHSTNRLDDGERFYFECPITETKTSVDDWSLNSTVFTDVIEFFRFSLYESNRCNIKIEDEFITIINNSKRDNPERWI